MRAVGVRSRRHARENRYKIYIHPRSRVARRRLFVAVLLLILRLVLQTKQRLQRLALIHQRVAFLIDVPRLLRRIRSSPSLILLDASALILVPNLLVIFPSPRAGTRRRRPRSSVGNAGSSVGNAGRFRRRRRPRRRRAVASARTRRRPGELNQTSSTTPPASTRGGDARAKRATRSRARGAPRAAAPTPRARARRRWRCASTQCDAL